MNTCTQKLVQSIHRVVWPSGLRRTTQGISLPLYEVSSYGASLVGSNPTAINLFFSVQKPNINLISFKKRIIDWQMNIIIFLDSATQGIVPQLENVTEVNRGRKCGEIMGFPLQTDTSMNFFDFH